MNDQNRNRVGAGGDVDDHSRHAVTRGAVVSVAGRVLGLAIIAAVQTYWFLQPVPVAAKGLAALVVVLSITRPAWGLLAFAGLAPLSTATATLCGGGAGLGAQLLEQMALGVGAGVLVRGRRSECRTRIGAPALLMSAVAVASAVALFPAAAASAPVVRSLDDLLLLKQLELRQTAQSSPVWAPLFAALLVAECGLLGWAVERTIRHTPSLAKRLVTMALIGHAGTALLNLQVVLAWALRTGDVLQALPGLLMRVRVSTQADWNAGASALLLAGVAGLGLLSRPLVRMAGIGALLLLVATGVWLTGSRIALAMGIGATIAATARAATRGGRRGRFMLAGVALLGLGIGAFLVLNGSSGRNLPISRSISGRLVMARVGLQMFEGAPVFGIGITKFYNASADFIGPTPGNTAWRENAHNNFIQVLAEQGLVGLGAMLWWLAAVLVSGTRAQLSKPDAGRGGLLLAIVACVGTWMTGHPLLVPEFAFVFWLYCGVLAAMTPAVPPTRGRWLVWALVAGVLATVPLRAQALRNAAELEHLGFDLSLWQHDDAQRYREAGASFSLFLASGRPVAVPVRLAPGAPDPIVVDVAIDGRLVDKVTIKGEAWQTILVLVPRDSRRFTLVSFLVNQPASGRAPGVLLRVGKAVPK